MSSTRMCSHCVSQNFDRDPVAKYGSEGVSAILGEGSTSYQTSYRVSAQQLEQAYQENCHWCTLIRESLFDHNTTFPKDASVFVRKEYRDANVGLAERSAYLLVIAEACCGNEPEADITRSLLGFRVHSAPTAAARIGLGSPHGPAEDSDETRLASLGKQAREWMDNCSNSHTYCRKDFETTLPTRLIDIYPSSIDGDAFACRLRSSEQGERGVYVALSYCWGALQPHATMNSTVEEYASQIPLHNVPQTIRDAVKFTHSLGIRYLWVDSYCIIQDCDEDKGKELTQIRKIFSDAYITIVASKAESAFSGFLGGEWLSSASAETFQVPREGGVFDDMCLRFEFLEEVYYPLWEPVNKRAWTLEERLLSKRALLFSTQGPLWQCEETELFFQDNTAPLPFITAGRERLMLKELAKARSNENNEAADLHRLWLDVVEDYSERQVTYERDKLKAIGGIAEEFLHVGDAKLGEYCAGIWSLFFSQGLCWEATRPSQRLQQQYRAPSWSWAAVDCPIGIRKYKWDENFTHFARLLSYEIDLEDKTFAFGGVTGGMAILQAPIGNAIWNRKRSNTDDAGQGNDLTIRGQGEDVAFAKTKADFENETTGAIEVTLLLLVVWERVSPEDVRDCEGCLGLILLPAANSAYKRVGTFRAYPSDILLDSCELQQVRLV